MSQQVRYIVDCLNRDPFNKELNLIVFDSFTGEQNIQTVSDVLTHIEGRNDPIDIREEPAELTLTRIMNTLRLLKYKPPITLDPQLFREGMLEGAKKVVYPVLDWLLNRMPELKTRAYLARFLVKLDIPQEYLVDTDIGDLAEQYENLIEEFKYCHKESQTLKNNGFNTQELRKDISEMENESDVVQKRIERVQRKLDGVPHVEDDLERARKLRRQNEKELDLTGQKASQRNSIHHVEQKISRHNGLLEKLRQNGMSSMNPEALLQKIQEEANVNAFLVEKKLPKEIDALRTTNANAEKVVRLPTLANQDIMAIKENIGALNKNIEEIQRNRNVQGDPMEDKLTLFRQQAAIIHRKKDNTGEKLNETRSEVQTLEEDLQEKRGHVQNQSEEVVLKGDDFKRYVTGLREKSTVYKQKRAVVSDLRAEYGILSRSYEILSSRLNNIQEHLSKVEKDQGISGYRQVQGDLEKTAASKSELDTAKGSSLNEISSLVNDLMMKINERKARLAPIIKELRPLRQTCEDMQQDYDERKSQYDTLMLQLESGMTRLENEVKKNQDLTIKSESDILIHTMMLAIEGQWDARAERELKRYVSRSSEGESAEKSVREEVLKIISNQEKRSKVLKEDQRRFKNTSESITKQFGLWTDMSRLFACKKNIANVNPEDGSIMRREAGTETLVL
eukprot:maker-scaffold1136_size60149-snap-gene-0.10 protein:Tk09877 transcript:maker-scaffold1136_size60149-snap-gene-0.10-mRNA-1 annotation:"predicted protein"